MAESNLSPAATLIRSRCLELGLNKARLIRLAGYKNEAKGIRRLDSLIAGDLETTRRLIQRLPAALNLPTDVISEVVDQTRQQIAATERRQAEQLEMRWRDNFRPHAIILTERTSSAPIMAATKIGSGLSVVYFSASKRLSRDRCSDVAAWPVTTRCASVVEGRFRGEA